MGGGNRTDDRTRRRVFWTVAALVLLALGFYVGFILVMATGS